MSDKQREDHIQAKYWGGPISRAEAQKVFDEQLNVIQMQAQAMAQFDAAISCIAEKVGITPADVTAWIQVKVKQAEIAQQKAAQPVEPAVAEATNGSADKAQEVPSLILTD